MRNYFLPELEEIVQDKKILEEKLDTCSQNLEEIDNFLQNHDDIPQIILNLIHSENFDLWDEYERLIDEMEGIEEKLKETREEIEEIDESARKNNCFCIELINE